MTLKEILEARSRFSIASQLGAYFDPIHSEPYSFKIDLTLLCDCGNVYKQKEKFDFKTVRRNSTRDNPYTTKRRSECVECGSKSLLEFYLNATSRNSESTIKVAIGLE